MSTRKGQLGRLKKAENLALDAILDIAKTYAKFDAAATAAAVEARKKQYVKKSESMDGAVLFAESLAAALAALTGAK